MHQSSRLLLLAAAAMAVAAPAAALAQSSPMPMSSSGPVAPMPMSTGSGTTGASPIPAPSPVDTAAPPSSTQAPASSSTAAPSGATRSTQPVQRSTNVPSIPNGAKVKQIKAGTLSTAQTVYGVTHPVQEAKQLLKMKTVNFDKLRLYRLPTSLKSTLKVGDAETERIAIALLGGGVQVAQTTPSLPATNGNNSPIQYLRDVLANINVSNALNNLNVLNGSNVDLNLALSNVLNNNKISIGQVVGLYIGGGGIITTITK